jgi:hypothetical protein
MKLTMSFGWRGIFVEFRERAQKETTAREAVGEKKEPFLCVRTVVDEDG